MREGNAAIALHKKAAPVSIVVRGLNSTNVNVETRSATKRRRQRATVGLARRNSRATAVT